VDQTRPTGLMLKQPSPSGSRVLYYRTGSAASALSPEDLEGLPIPRLVHLSGITPALSASARAMVEALLDGALSPALTSFDVNYRPALWCSAERAASVLHDLACRADVVLVGRDEAEVLWGTSTIESVRAILPDVPRLVIKDGAIEAVEFHGDHLTRVPAQQVDVVEPVGAGDAFAAGWIASLLREGDAHARLRSGHAAAAVVLCSPHDTPALPR
jgi:2-dehydro-3-deoxygluconokinase